MTMEEVKLKPCPLCGGAPRIEEKKVGFARNDATIVCQTCGLQLEWEQQFVTYESLDGGKFCVPTDISPEDAWNRRADVRIAGS